MEPLERALVEIDGVAAILASCKADALPRMGTAALLAWAERRSALHDALHTSEARVLACLDEAAPTPAIRARLRELKTAVDKLAARDQERSTMLNCVRAVVRGYLAVLAPPARAYGPGGAVTPGPLPARTSSRV